MRLILMATMATIMASPAAAQKLQIVLPPPAQVREIPAGAKPQPVKLVRISSSIPGGKKWAEVAQNPLCITEESLEWEASRNAVPPDAELERAFGDALAKARLAVGSDPDNLFEERTGSPSNLQIGALITDVRGKFCAFSGGDPFKGTLVMKVQWQVYSVTQAKVVARIEIEGGAELKRASDAADTILLVAAFGDSALRLTASDEFRAIVLADDATPTVATPGQIALRAPPPSPMPLNIAVKSVVTIFAGEGMGSGVLISSDGYILTNHHVAGSTGRVRVRWPDGTDTTGEVIRGDPRRDVALVKTQAKSAPLSIRAAPAQLGETVFAVGTPLDKQFANTLTRGIVSATRLIDGLSVIQSDVAIDHGSSGGPLLDEKGQIVALTVSRAENNGVGHDINFFIPIADALKALAIQPTGGS